MRFGVATAIFCALVASGGCSVPPARDGGKSPQSEIPWWVKDQQASGLLSDEHFLYDVGVAPALGNQAESREQADKRALSQLASYFRTRVTSQLEDEVRIVQSRVLDLVHSERSDLMRRIQRGALVGYRRAANE